ncbi:unnamed protein product [Linum tenue]|uniref:Cytochrome P450 n=1 Tax=Linum tenue TaxID=586396 RepID=A0AAV0RYM7_9ROSI|nr:unnamed protein product [Linum tenue]
MNDAIFATALSFLATIFSIVITSKLLISRKRRRTDRPPSPPSLPFIGHLHLLNQPVHRTLQALSTKYGAVFSLALGTRNVVVISSPSLAEECLAKNDLVFANRPDDLIGWKIFAYNYTTLGTAPYGPHWINLRRFSTVELLSADRLNASLHVRRDEVRRLVSALQRQSQKLKLEPDSATGEVWSGFTKVAMRSRLVGLVMNMVMRMVAGKRYFDDESSTEEGERFKELIGEVLELSATSNPGDFLPVLRWIGYGGLERRMWRAQGKSDAFFQRLIEEHRSNKPREEGGGGRKTTMIDAMLSLQESEPETYTDDVIKGQAMIVILAGTDTTATLIEWVMAALLNHPEILSKARTEIDNVVGNSRIVEESDCPNLPYLQLIIKETFRLYPPAPTLMPHQSSEDCTVGGYSIAKGTMLLINAWAIHRDAAIWKDPTRFRPERHGGGGGAGGVDGYKLLSYGMGRRSCPGSGLASRAVSVAVGALIQCFEWERIGEELLDMSEGHGLTMPKLEPLEALCRSREVMKDVLLSL